MSTITDRNLISGAGIFVTTVVAGSVMLTGEFEVMQRPLMRDMAFYIGAAFMVWFIIWKARIYFKHAVGNKTACDLICIYIIKIYII